MCLAYRETQTLTSTTNPVRLLHSSKGRDGHPLMLIQMGDPIVCVDYSCQQVSVGGFVMDKHRLWGRTSFGRGDARSTVRTG